ncbi:AraC family transcriptional regulator [Flavobacterium acetivorans]|uniref:AraC family transcriptional regulator n=1 Tax=Flavobacterium acetivorans TaxID=2893883 RepID=UPI001E408462|nr:AraC family transcriptional regulator [Flavobacterium sp. F-29]UFH35009.1 helix-turn-helix transcriptional regulator [Flavobacterium sp. F-29]
MLSNHVQLIIRKASKESTPILISTVKFESNDWQLHSNYFAIVWVHEGTGMLETDLMKAKYTKNQIFCFNTYQAFSFHPKEKTSASLLLFHANFFCIETYHHQVGCNGILFNNVYDSSQIIIPEIEKLELDMIFSNIRDEIKEEELASNELVFSYLKIFLIKLTRLKSVNGQEEKTVVPSIPEYLKELIVLINENFQKEHQASFYANKLNISVKTLSKATTKHYQKTISGLLHEKLILKSKWELLHTNTPIKAIANNMGFRDEYYFSRFFKKHIGLSPKHFREEEWNIRRGFLSIP